MKCFELSGVIEERDERVSKEIDGDFFANIMKEDRFEESGKARRREIEERFVGERETGDEKFEKFVEERRDRELLRAERFGSFEGVEDEKPRREINEEIFG